MSGSAGPSTCHPAGMATGPPRPYLASGRHGAARLRSLHDMLHTLQAALEEDIFALADHPGAIRGATDPGKAVERVH